MITKCYHMILFVIIFYNILLSLGIKFTYYFVILALLFHIIIYINLLLKISFLYFYIKNCISHHLIIKNLIKLIFYY